MLRPEHTSTAGLSCACAVCDQPSAASATPVAMTAFVFLFFPSFDMPVLLHADAALRDASL